MLLLDLIMLVASVETVDVANVPTPRATVTANLSMTCMFGSSLSGDIATIVEFQRARATYASANRGAGRAADVADNDQESRPRRHETRSSIRLATREPLVQEGR